jgi:hypothetical protein
VTSTRGISRTSACTSRRSHGDPDVHDVTPEMLLDGAQQHPIGSYGIVRTSYRGFFGWAEDWENVLPNPARRLPRKRPQPMKVYDVFTAAEQAQLIKAADLMPLPWIQRLRVLCVHRPRHPLRRGTALQPSTSTPSPSRRRERQGRQRARRAVRDDFFRAFVGYRNRPIPNVRMTDERRALARASAAARRRLPLLPAWLREGHRGGDVDGSVPASL